MSFEDFIVMFFWRYDKIRNLDMKDELKQHVLIKQANFDRCDCNSVVGGVGYDYTLQALAPCMRNALSTERPPVALMNTNSLRYPRSSFSTVYESNGQSEQTFVQRFDKNLHHQWALAFTHICATTEMTTFRLPLSTQVYAARFVVRKLLIGLCGTKKLTSWRTKAYVSEDIYLEFQTNLLNPYARFVLRFTAGGSDCTIRHSVWIH